METKNTIKSFTDLIAWQQAHALVLMIYKSTDLFPQKEMFSLIDQIRRCSISISSNISEGFSRQGKKEKLQFYYISLGSLTELQNQLLVSKDVGYLPKMDFDKIAEQTVVVSKLINGLIKSIKSNTLNT